MFKNLLVALLVGLVSCGLVLGDDRAERTRNRVKNKQSCHMKELSVCATEADETIKKPGSSKMIASAEGIAQLCSIAGNARTCLEAYLKRCGTPIQNELYKFFTEPGVRRGQEFCTPGPLQNGFLKHSPCMESKVLRDETYRNVCVSDFLAATDYVDTKVELDEKMVTMCCAYHRWMKCSEDVMVDKCGADSISSMKTLVQRGLAGFLVTICPDNMFGPGATTCTEALPPTGTAPKGEQSENPFQKYASSYMSLIFDPK